MFKWLQAKARKLLGVDKSNLMGPPGPMGPMGLSGVFRTADGREIKATFNGGHLIFWVEGCEYAFLPDRVVRQESEVA